MADGRRLPIGEVNVGGGIGVPARDDEPAVDLDAYAALLARHLGPLGVVVGANPATTCRRTPRSCSARSSRSRSVAASRSSGSTSAGTSTARISSTATCRRSCRSRPSTRRAPRSSRSRATSTRRATYSPRTTRWPGRRGRHRGPAQRGRLPPGDELDPLPPSAGGRDLPGSLRSPQLRTRSIAIRISGRVSRSWPAYCGYFARSASMAEARSAGSSARLARPSIQARRDGPSPRPSGR